MSTGPLLGRESRVTYEAARHSFGYCRGDEFLDVPAGPPKDGKQPTDRYRVTRFDESTFELHVTWEQSFFRAVLRTVGET